MRGTAILGFQLALLSASYCICGAIESTTSSVKNENFGTTLQPGPRIFSNSTYGDLNISSTTAPVSSEVQVTDLRGTVAPSDNSVVSTPGPKAVDNGTSSLGDGGNSPVSASPTGSSDVRSTSDRVTEESTTAAQMSADSVSGSQNSNANITTGDRNAQLNATGSPELQQWFTSPIPVTNQSNGNVSEETRTSLLNATSSETPFTNSGAREATSKKPATNPIPPYDDRNPVSNGTETDRSVPLEIMTSSEKPGIGYRVANESTTNEAATESSRNTELEQNDPIITKSSAFKLNHQELGGATSPRDVLFNTSTTAVASNLDVSDGNSTAEPRFNTSSTPSSNVSEASSSMASSNADLGVTNDTTQTASVAPANESPSVPTAKVGNDNPEGDPSDLLYQRCRSSKRRTKCFGDKRNCFQTSNCTFLGAVDESDSAINVSLTTRAYNPTKDLISFVVTLKRGLTEDKKGVLCDKISFQSFQIKIQQKMKEKSAVNASTFSKTTIDKQRLRQECETLKQQDPSLQLSDKLGLRFIIRPNDSSVLVPLGIEEISTNSSRKSRKLETTLLAQNSTELHSATSAGRYIKSTFLSIALLVVAAVANACPVQI